MAERSKEIIEVGYYLSRFGVSNPPPRFGDIKWNEVYRMFFEKLGQGREILEFEHSLKNTRDGFDGYFPETKREGWKDKDGNPARLPTDAQIVFSRFKNLAEAEIYNQIKIHLSNGEFNNSLLITEFKLRTSEVNLFFNELILRRFTASLLTKPFVILTGLSGSGKTKLAQAFVTWISASPSQFKIIPVGADWTNREPLLGYPNGLKNELYVAPDSGSLQLLIEASKKENENTPYFLILDEMNLSHVERYFADFLSVMESQDKIRLHSGGDRKIPAINKNDTPVDVPHEIGWPRNLFIIGTVNIDETTYMFSPKVLDRANVIEFRISETEMDEFLGKPSKPDLSKLLVDGKEEKGGLGQDMAGDFMTLANDKSIAADTDLKDKLGQFFNELQKAGAEFGYRSASEILLLIKNLDQVSGESKMGMNEKLDIAIMQKLLPKLHGSRNKLVKVLETLAGLCLKKEEKRKLVKTEYLEPFSKNEKTEADFKEDEIRYKISFLKLCRMYKAAMENGYASYAEA
jgi:5-methylcytosine-specific restriction protein B